jgi:hypothetical protein
MFTVVRRYPDDYPLAIEDEELARSFEQGLRFRAALVVGDRGTRTEKNGVVQLRRYDRECLRLELVFSPPPIDVACAVELAIPDLDVHAQYSLLLGPAKPGSLPERNTFDAEGSHGGRSWLDGGVVVHATEEVDLDRLIGSRDAQDLVGKRVILTISPSRAVALSSSDDLERFLMVSAVRECTIGLEQAQTCP